MVEEITGIEKKIRGIFDLEVGLFGEIPELVLTEEEVQLLPYYENKEYKYE